MKFLISAGEASSDLYGAQLIVALRRRARADDEPLEFMGVGGEAMRAAGCDIVVEARHLAVVGMTEILSHLPKIYSEFRKLLRVVDQNPKKPGIAIVIDSPAFNFRVARAMHGRGIPVVYFVAPQLWAWREYRIRRVQKWIKKVLCIFPFEEDFYRTHRVDVEYVGHPLADLADPTISREEYARQNRLDPAATWVALLPGSRRREVQATLSTLAEGAAFLRKDAQRPYSFLVPVASNLDFDWVTQQIKSCLPPSRDLTITPVNDARLALFHSRAAVVTSGTATVEAALMGCPFVAVYRLSPLTFWLAKRLARVLFAAMPNLIAGRQIVPELLQADFTPERVAVELGALLEDGERRQQALAGLAEVRQKLKSGPDVRKANAVERAADAILRLLPPDESR